MSEHATLPHDQSILNSNCRPTDGQRDRKVFIGHEIVAITVLVEDRASENKARQCTELNGFVQAIPDAVDAEADIEQCGAKPCKPDEGE